MIWRVGTSAAANLGALWSRYSPPAKSLSARLPGVTTHALPLPCNFDRMQLPPFDSTPLPAGQGVRFLVSDLEHETRSATWKVWTSRNHDDVYVLELATGKDWKVSHHLGTGIMSVAMTSEAAAQSSTPRVSIDRWTHLSPEDEWREGAAILFPRQYLLFDDSSIESDTHCVPTVSGSNAVIIRLAFEEEHAQPIKLHDSLLVTTIERSSGGRVHVVAQPFQMSRQLEQSCEAFRMEFRQSIPAAAMEKPARFVGVLATPEHRLLVDFCF